MNQSALTKNIFYTFPIRLMPSRMKRLIYLSSLIATLRNTDSLDISAANKINNVLKLSSTGTNALMLPVSLSRSIWANKIVIDGSVDKIKSNIDDKDAVLNSIYRIIDLTPKWIRYGRREDMVKDLLSVFCRDNNLVF